MGYPAGPFPCWAQEPTAASSVACAGGVAGSTPPTPAHVPWGAIDVVAFPSSETAERDGLVQHDGLVQVDLDDAGQAVR